MSRTDATLDLATPKPRLVGLDVLRFVAVSLVLHIHALQAFGPAQPEIASGLVGRLFEMMPSGARGVDIFFVLSGFLVFGLFFEELRRTRTVRPGSFLIRRGFKIYPAFWVLILVTVIVQFHQSGQFNLRGLFAELFFFQNYVRGLWYHTWTLAVEEHFYLLLAAVFLMLKHYPDANGKLKLGLFPRVVDAVILLCLAARILTWWFSHKISPSNSHWLGSVTHVRIDALFFGAWLAYGWNYEWNEASKARLLSLRYLWLALGLLLISPVSESLMDVEVWHIFGLMVVYVGAGFLLLAALALDHFPQPAWLKWPAWLGRHSYSVYLWHMLVLACLQRFLGGASSNLCTFLFKESVYVTLCWIIGIILARLIEFPALRLRDRLFPAGMKNPKPA